jgi:hypothetical protein
MTEDTWRKDIDVVNDLISIALDSAEGYADAAEHATDPNLIQLFSARSGTKGHRRGLPELCPVIGRRTRG